MKPSSKLAPWQLIVFAKAPFPGYAKTRLIPALGAAGAARVHCALLRHCLATARQADCAHVTLFYSDAHPLLLRLAKQFRCNLQAQTAGDLGLRMQRALCRTNRPTLLMGSDAPVITPAMLKLCRRALLSHDCVFLPAEDGGFGLIGSAAPQAQPLQQLLAAVTWGQDTVMTVMRERLQQLGLSWAEPARIWDVDRPEDLKRLATVGDFAAAKPPTITQPSRPN